MIVLLGTRIEYLDEEARVWQLWHTGAERCFALAVGPGRREQGGPLLRPPGDDDHNDDNDNDHDNNNDHIMTIIILLSPEHRGQGR